MGRGGGLTSSDFTGTCLVGVRCFLIVSSIAPEKIASFTELEGLGGWGVVSIPDRVDGCLNLTDSSIIIPGSSDVFNWKSNRDNDSAGSVFFVNKLSTDLVMLPLLSRTDRIALANFFPIPGTDINWSFEAKFTAIFSSSIPLSVSSASTNGSSPPY